MRRILLCLILLAMAVGMLLASNQRASKPLSTIDETVETENGTTATTTSFVDENGDVVFANDKGYASVRKTKNADRKVVLEEYLGTDGQQVRLAAGYSAISRVYEGKLNTEIHYLDESGEPVVIKNGYDTVRRTYNRKRLADTDTYWIQDQQVVRRQGYAQYCRTYNDKKQLVKVEYKGLDGEPAILSSGQSGYRREYDDEGRVIETTYLGTDGEPINVKTGYATVRTSYEEDGGKKTQYYDATGEPVTIGKSQYGILKSGGQDIYLDEDGEPMLRIDNILNNQPLLVFAGGILLTVAAILVRGKGRIAFLVFYLVVIGLMTIAWRESGDSRGAFALFRSYRRFLTNDATRQAIINNIWLFIPLGACVANICCQSGRWGALGNIFISVLICLGVSVLVEVIQWVFGIGLAEADDVVSNGIGGLIGAAVCVLWKGSGKAAGQETTRTPEHSNVR